MLILIKEILKDFYDLLEIRNKLVHPNSLFTIKDIGLNHVIDSELNENEMHSPSFHMDGNTTELYYRILSMFVEEDEPFDVNNIIS